MSSLQEKIIELTEKLEKATTIDTTTTITTATTTKSATEKSSSIEPPAHRQRNVVSCQSHTQSQ